MTFKIPDIDGMFSEIAGIPKIARGLVWCTKCGRVAKVDGNQCVRHGWPMCCGYTMTIDSPAERAALGAK
jgi:hypothetical protein